MKLPYPCEGCKNKKPCSSICPLWLEWQAEQWQGIQQAYVKLVQEVSEEQERQRSEQNG